MTSDSLQADVISVDASRQPAEESEEKTDPEFKFYAVVEENSEWGKKDVANVCANTDSENVESVEDSANPDQKDGQD